MPCLYVYTGLVYSYVGSNDVELRLSLERSVPVLRVRQRGSSDVTVYARAPLPNGRFTPIEVDMSSQSGKFHLQSHFYVNCVLLLVGLIAHIAKCSFNLKVTCSESSKCS